MNILIPKGELCYDCECLGISRPVQDNERQDIVITPAGVCRRICAFHVEEEKKRKAA